MKKRNLRKINALVAGLILGVGIFPVLSGAQSAETRGGAFDETAAQETALADAGVQEADAQRLRTRPDREDGEDVIEVEFSSEGNEYEYVFRVQDGMILEWSVEGRDAGSAEAELSLVGAGTGSGAGTDTGTDAGTVPDGSAADKDAAGTDAGAASDQDVAGTESGAGAGTAMGVVTVDGTELIGIGQAKQIVFDDLGAADGDAAIVKMKFEYGGRFYDYEFEVQEGRSEFEYRLDAQTGEIVEVERD